MMTPLTKEQLMTLSGCTSVVADKFLPYVNEILPRFGIDTPKRLAMFFAQVGHESASMSILEENLNYSADGLANTWPKRYAKEGSKTGSYARSQTGRYIPSQKALNLHRKPVEIANDCYAGRMGNGTPQTGDGWKYRGRGLLQTTGRSNYQSLKDATGLDVVTDPDILKTPHGSLISACYFWHKNNLNRLADIGDVQGVTKVINGGTNGLLDRKARYEKAMKAF